MPRPRKIKSKKEASIPAVVDVDKVDQKKQLSHPEINQDWNNLKRELQKLIAEFPALPLRITPREYGEYYYPKQAEWLQKLKKLVGA